MRLPLLLLFCLILPVSVLAREVRGPARIIDGDTLELRGQVVRLLDIDAPETGQDCHGSPCGTEATNFLKRLTARQQVSCQGMRWMPMTGCWPVAPSTVVIWAPRWCWPARLSPSAAMA